jgi:hypothetical protein
MTLLGGPTYSRILHNLNLLPLYDTQIALPLAMGTAGLAAGQWGAGAMVGIQCARTQPRDGTAEELPHLAGLIAQADIRHIAASGACACLTCGVRLLPVVSLLLLFSSVVRHVFPAIVS